MAEQRRTSLRMRRLACVAALFGVSAGAQASAPQCALSNGSPYCQYTGVVAGAYVNASNEVILYFDTPVAPTSLSAVGISGVSIYTAAIYEGAANPDFVKELYASLLWALARGSTVSVQMSSVSQGYLQMDRVWVSP